MAFEDLRELLDEQVLRLPIGGVEYPISACSAEDWLWLNAQSTRLDRQIKGGEVDADVEGDDQVLFFRRCLGDTFDEMVADEVTSKELQIASLTAFFWHLGNVQLAEAVWINGGKALVTGDSEILQEELKKAQLPGNRASRRATSRTSAKPASATSRGTGASRQAKTTRASSRRTA